MATDEEHDEGELKEVVKDEVTSNGGGCLDMFRFVREEVPHIGNLEEEESEPVERSNDRVQGKRRVAVSIVLAPDRVSPSMMVIVWHAEGIVYAGDDGEEP